MIDPWQSILKDLEPSIDRLTFIMENGPYIKPVLYPVKSKKWRITLEEIWPEDINLSHKYTNSSLLNDAVNAVSIELDQWAGVTRQSWDTWDFSSKRDAERFIIMYNLKWGR